MVPLKSSLCVCLFQTVKETLEHCEEVPADRGLMENFRDLVVSSLKARVLRCARYAVCRLYRSGTPASIFCLQELQQQRDLAERNYSSYKEVIWKLQHQLEESRRKIQEYQVGKDLSELLRKQRDTLKGPPSQQ